MRRKLAAGNWKMNGSMAALAELGTLSDAHPAPTVDVLICPPATHLAPALAAVEGTKIQIGAQDCHTNQSGAHTGDISAEMIRDIGANHVILGHSERRTDHAESSEEIREKARAVHEAGLVAIICLGETLSQREAANTLDIIGGQLSASVPDGVTAQNTVIAYEPVWAIGTGLTPSTDQIGEVHDFIRGRLETRFGAGVGRSMRILYGGSVKGSNADEIFAVSNVDGALVGGASLKRDDFSPIISALETA